MRVLNGFTQALNGLHDFALLANDAEGRALFTAGEAQLRAELPAYDTGAWSRYSLHTEADLSYHKLARDFLVNLCTRLEEDAARPAGGRGPARRRRRRPAAPRRRRRRRPAAPLRRPGAVLRAPRSASRATSAQPPVVKLVSQRVRAGKPAALRLALSKPSYVKLAVVRGGRTFVVLAARLGSGRRALRLARARAPASGYEVQLRATDLAGNVGTAKGELEVLKARRKRRLSRRAPRVQSADGRRRRARGSSRPRPTTTSRRPSAASRVIGIKERNRARALQMEPGDRIVLYLTKVMRFARRDPHHRRAVRGPRRRSGPASPARSTPTRGALRPSPSSCSTSRAGWRPRPSRTTSSTSASGRPSTGSSPSRASCARSPTPTPRCSWTACTPRPASRVKAGASRLRAASGALDRDQRFAAGAALALLVAMFLPWYEKSVVVAGSRAFANDSISAFGAVSFVEAAIFLVSAGVLVLVLARAEGGTFHLPGGDGTVILAAGAVGERADLLPRLRPARRQRRRRHGRHPVGLLRRVRRRRHCSRTPASGCARAARPADAGARAAAVAARAPSEDSTELVTWSDAPTAVVPGRAAPRAGRRRAGGRGGRRAAARRERRRRPRRATAPRPRDRAVRREDARVTVDDPPDAPLRRRASDHARGGRLLSPGGEAGLHAPAGANPSRTAGGASAPGGRRRRRRAAASPSAVTSAESQLVVRLARQW